MKPDKKTDATERRTLDAPLPLAVERRDDAPPMIVGYAAIFNSPADIGGWFREVVLPGAFAKSLSAGIDVRALFNHNPDLLLGRRSAKTLTVTEDSKGLRYEIVPPDTQAGRDLLVSIERGDVTGSSFGFLTIADTWTYTDGEDDLRELVEVEPIDVSPVTFPAYEDTEVGVRSQQAWRKAQGMTNLERAAIIAGI